MFIMEKQFEFLGLSYGTTMLRVYQASICLQSDGCLRKGTLWWMSAMKPFLDKKFPNCRPLFLGRTNDCWEGNIMDFSNVESF